MHDWVDIGRSIMACVDSEDMHEFEVYNVCLLKGTTDSATTTMAARSLLVWDQYLLKNI